MWQERQDKLLRDEIKVLVTSLSGVTGLYDLVEEALTKARQRTINKAAYNRPWPLLPLIVCEAISGHYEHAIPAAAALQLLKSSAEVLDDVEDKDSSESLSTSYGTALATNAATTLLILAERAITRLKERGVEDHIIIRVMDAINSFCTTACAGQHLDLSISSESSISEDEYLRIIGMKSASKLECVCHIGALLANAKQPLIDMFTKFGHNLGMASQITNDIQGIIHGSDIANRRVTLPVIYALAQTDGEVHNQLKLIFNEQAESILDPISITDILFRTGAVYYATVKMEFYKQRALDILSDSEKAGVSVEKLKLFLV